MKYLQANLMDPQIWVDGPRLEVDEFASLQDDWIKFNTDMLIS